MSFDIVKAETRTARMIGMFAGTQQKVTDFLPGSVSRTKFEAIALEMEQQDFSYYQALRKFIPVSVYDSFDFGLLPATRGSGTVVFTASSPPSQNMVIPVRTQIAAPATATEPEKVYETSQEATLLAGELSVSVPVVSLVVGTSGNTGPATISLIKTSAPGIIGVTNPTGISNGTDTETSEGRRRRFQDYIKSLSRGTFSAVEYGAKLAQLSDSNGPVTERVVQAKAVDDTSTPAGRIFCYVYNGSGAASPELLAEAQRVINGYVDDSGKPVPGFKAAGVVCTVREAVRVPVPVVCTITTLPGVSADRKTEIVTESETVLGNYFGSFEISQPLIYHKIIDLLMTLNGVYNVSISSPLQDIQPHAGQIIIASAITVTVA